MITAEIEARRAALFAATSTATLADACRELYSQPRMTAQERRAAAWTADELTRRVPAIDAILDRFAADDDDMRDYGAWIVAALAEVGAL